MRKYYESNNFEDIYIDILDTINEAPEYTGEARGIGFKEVTNLSFELTDPSDNIVKNSARNFNLEFAKKFFDWMIAGETDITKLTGVNKNAKNYMADGELPDNFSTAYGPRIVRQLPRVFQLLNEDKETRRAVIHVLEEGDKIIWDVETKMEYPCTSDIQLMVRGNKLNMYVKMRSNNMVLTVCYDVYNFTNLQKYIAEKLNLEVGVYYQNIVSAHFFTHEQELVNKILNEAYK